MRVGCWMTMVLGITAAANGQPCSAFEPLRELGMLGLLAPVDQAAAFDPDGAGPSPTLLYIASNYNIANGVTVHRLMTFDGQNFAQVTSAPFIGYSSMTTYDVGSGPMLYIAGGQGLYRYSGAGWAPVTLPIPGAPTKDLKVFDPDGPGPIPLSLHMTVQTPEYRYVVYRYNALGWTALSEPYTSLGRLVVFDADGPGPEQADFYSIRSWSNCPSPCNSGAEVRRLSSTGTWNLIGEMWSEPPYFGIAQAAVFDLDGDGPGLPKLVITGILDPSVFAGEWAAAWDGNAWSAVEDPPSLANLTRFDPDGAGPAAPFLVASVGGDVYNEPGVGLVRLEGSSWEPFGGVTGGVRLITEYSPTPSGPPMLVVSGFFGVAGHQAARNFAVYQDGVWRNVVPGPAGPVGALEVFNDGTGQKLFAGGAFVHVGGEVANNIARWDGSAWQTVGAGVHAGSGPSRISAMAVHNDGSGWALYVGGRFDHAGAQAASNVARWTGQQWQAVGSGVGGGVGGGEVRALVSHDPDGPGALPPALYAGGDFAAAGGVSAPGLARWSGGLWHAVPGYQQGSIRSFRSFDDGTGRALYMAGEGIVAGGHAPSSVARLDGSGWSALPPLGKASARVNTLAIHVHGGDYRIHALGEGIAAVLYPGQWVALPPPPVEVFAARSFQGPREHALLIGGYQLTQTGWKWMRPMNGSARALSPLFDDGSGPAVFVGGDFTHVWAGATERLPSPQVARLRPCVEGCYANCDESGWTPALNVADFTCFLQRFAAADAYANCDQSVAAPALNVADFTCFLQRFAAGCE